MNYLKQFYLTLVLCCLPLILFAQTETQDKDRKPVELVIHKLFDGMREGDSSKVASVFHPEVTMFTSFTNKEGQKKIRKGAIKPFLEAIGTPHDQVWDEKIWNTKILIDGGVAQVWTDYSFFVGEKFSHCGVDAFNLVRDEKKGWIIVNLMDTRRKDECQITEE